MERKLVAIDLDGTTLNDNSQITTETKQTIQKIVNQGDIVSIATGRPFRTSSHFYKQLQLNTPMVNFNGAWCHHPNDFSWEHGYYRTLARDVALSITELKTNSQIKFIAAESGENVYVDRPADKFQLMGTPIRDIKTVPFTADNLNEDPISVNVFTTKEKFIPDLQKIIVDRYGSDVEVRTWGGQTPTLEIVSAGIQKAIGVEKIADYYEISRENIIAFGDEANDFEMIQYAGHGVVMKNGIKDLKNVADEITSVTNHDNGLAKHLTGLFSL